jgi:hypothetical protein
MLAYDSPGGRCFLQLGDDGCTLRRLFQQISFETTRDMLAGLLLQDLSGGRLQQGFYSQPGVGNNLG